jgi:enoyl-CoA hydratase
VPVDIELRGAVALLTLNRPEALNAFSPELLEDLDARLGEIEADGAVRAVVLTGAGPKAFSAGADISHMREATPLQARAFGERGQAVTRRIEELRAPVIAAVNGYALGGGCEVALACDIRLAAEGARFAQPEVNLGILPGWGGTQRLVRLTGPAFAKEMIFTGRQVRAEEAVAAGLANRVHPAEELLDRALELAETIAQKPPFAIAASKRLANLAYDGDHASKLARELDAFALAFATEDQREGMAAFFEKRTASFSGR